MTSYTKSFGGLLTAAALAGCMSTPPDMAAQQDQGSEECPKLMESQETMTDTEVASSRHSACAAIADMRIDSLKGPRRSGAATPLLLHGLASRW